MVESNAGAGRGRGGGRNRRRPQDPDVEISKYMSYILRHNAQKVGLDIRPDGCVKVDDFLELQKMKHLKVDLTKLKAIVDSNDKKRYEFKENDDGVLFIRATQGHSM